DGQRQVAVLDRDGAPGVVHLPLLGGGAAEVVALVVAGGPGGEPDRARQHRQPGPRQHAHRTPPTDTGSCPNHLPDSPHPVNPNSPDSQVGLTRHETADPRSGSRKDNGEGEAETCFGGGGSAQPAATAGSSFSLTWNDSRRLQSVIWSPDCRRVGPA